MTSPDYVKAVVSIHTTSDINSPHIDYDDVANVQIHSTENYGETGTLQLINNYRDPTKNLLSDTCTLWSDNGARKIDRAMFVRIYADERTQENAIGVYLMASLSVSDDLITVTFCDSVQYLRSIGSEYVRNHSETTPTWHAHKTEWDATNNCGVIHHDADITVHGGGYGDVKFFKKNAFTVSSAIWFIRAEWVKIHIPITTETYIHQIPSINRGGRKITKIEIICNGEIVYSKEIAIHESKIYPNITVASDIEIKYYFISSLGGNITGDKTGWTATTAGGTVRENTGVEGDYVFAYATTSVEGQDLSTTLWKITSVDGESITESEFTPNWLGKAQLYYINTESRIAADTIFNRILQAYNFNQIGNIGQRGVNVFRCNGDFIHNYLLALADMPDDIADDFYDETGRQYAFCSSPYTWNAIITGRRYQKSDESYKSLAYAGDNVLDATAVMSFNPSISLKNHPRLAVAKGTAENDVPIMVALLDPNVPVGASTPSVNGTITTAVEGALGVYSTIITNRSDDWQGEIKLSGIDLDYMTEYGDVGGIPIRITDSRYGFAAYEAKVKEVVWDFANQTTTLTVNNYSEMYSNSILDTAKMAYSSGDLSAEASNKDMFCRQFIMINKTDTVAPSTMTTMKAIIPGGTDGTTEDLTTINLPELNVMLVYAYFDHGNGVATTQYGVQSIQLDGTTYQIPEQWRPDKYANQSLIVNILYKLS